jgi:hypothetical protein
MKNTISDVRQKTRAINKVVDEYFAARPAEEME